VTYFGPVIDNAIIFFLKARRAFHALKGIIRLQALVRGHLVRRQAVVTLYSMLGIIKLQALVRGQKVRASGLGLEVKTKFSQGKAVVKVLNWVLVLDLTLALSISQVYYSLVLHWLLFSLFKPSHLLTMRKQRYGV